jgi:hypothetical protein
MDEDTDAGRILHWSDEQLDILRERIQRWSDEQIDEANRKRWAAMTDEEKMAEYIRLTSRQE